MDFQKQAPLEEAFLRDDIQSRLAIVAAQQSAERQKGRRNEEAGKSLVRRLQTLEIKMDQGLVDDLLRGESLSMGFKLLGEQKADGASALAGKLRDEAVQTFTAWLAQQPPAPADKAIERLAGRIDELVPLVSNDEAANWRSRLAEADKAEPARRHLLLDGLEVESGSGERMQMRPIAFASEGEGPDPSQDRDAETIWCGDVTSLQDSLAKVGGGLTIEKSFAIGETPLKRVASTPRTTQRGKTIAKPKTRALR